MGNQRLPGRVRDLTAGLRLAGQKIGAGRLWLAALAVFTATSGLCAAAPGIDPLIALRLAQGLAAGLLIPAGRTILGQAVGPARLGQVMATAGIAVGAAPAVGPFIGRRQLGRRQRRDMELGMRL